MATNNTTDNGQNFPHPTLTPIIGKPSFLTLQGLQKELYANARIVDFSQGGGEHGHLGIVMNAVAYLALAGVAYVVPAHPGLQDDHPVGLTSAQIVERNRQYDARVSRVKLHKSVENALRK